MLTYTDSSIVYGVRQAILSYFFLPFHMLSMLIVAYYGAEYHMHYFERLFACRRITAAFVVLLFVIKAGWDLF